MALGCSSGAPAAGPSSIPSQETEVSSEAPAEPLDLNGEWRQVNTPSALGYHKAVIADGAISIYWVDDKAETESLYWAGSYDAPTEPVETWSWVSENDRSQTASSMYASSVDEKDFEYVDGQILYEASALGRTQTVRLERV